MKRSFLAVLLVVITFLNTFSQSIGEYKTKEEALSKLKELYPKDADYIFNVPVGWKSIPFAEAKVISVNEGEDKIEAQKIIDNNTKTSWTTKNYIKKPFVLIDFGSQQNFNKIVLYNRQTDNRGSGGGNNAVKTIEISFSNDAFSNFTTIGKFELTGPKAVCVKIKGAGQICTFIDEKEPNVLEIQKVNSRYLKISFVEAFWDKEAPEEWKNSFSLSEVMLFNN